MPPGKLRFFIAASCISLLLVVPSSAELFRQYDPGRLDELNQSGLLEPIDKEKYEEAMATLNASSNQTLGCDDYPRCNPDLLPNPAPLSPAVAAVALVGAVFLGNRIAGR